MSRHAIDTFSSFAEGFEASRRLMIEPYDEFYSGTVAALALAERPIRRILDLGAGTGVLSRLLRAAYPEAEVVLLDGSAEMLEKARGTISEPVSFTVADLRDPLPPGSFDAVTSTMAIHHLPHAEQADLYRRIHDVVAAGGVFVNGEVIGGAGPRTVDAYQRWHEHSVRSRGGTDADWSAYLVRQEADICAPVADHLRWLSAAGFEEVDCLYKQHMYGIVVGLRAG